MKQLIFSYLIAGLFVWPLNTFSQFAPPAGQNGTTAIYKDSSIIVAWANKCTIVRGLQDISTPSGGYADVGDSSNAVGIAGTAVVSLGDGGSAILRFATPIADGAGPDFAVFENSFDDSFLELAFVEASSDGINFFRFPAVSNTDTTVQTGSFGQTDATKINNLAGKYRAEYGTPFDLADIPDHILFDRQAITHVKVIDVVGCIQNQYCTRDVNLHKVNDPWPTGFGAGGFDLDAVGVIHQQSVGVKELEGPLVTLYPNPVTDLFHINFQSREPSTFYISNIVGEVIYESQEHSNLSVVNFTGFEKGVYVLSVLSGHRQHQIKLVKN